MYVLHISQDQGLRDVAYWHFALCHSDLPYLLHLFRFFYSVIFSNSLPFLIFLFCQTEDKRTLQAKKKHHRYFVGCVQGYPWRAVTEKS